MQFRYLPMWRAIERLILLHDQLRLTLRVGDAGDAVKPAVHSLAIFFRVPVITGTDIESDVLLGAHQSVQPLQARIRFFDAARIEEILLLAEQDNGLGRHGRDEVRMIEPERKDVWRALFSISGQLILHVSAECGDETT